MLNLNFVAKLHPDGEPPEFITAVKAIENELTACDSLKPFRQLLRLDLAGNKFLELGGLSASTSLKWLSVANNELATIPQLDIPELQVLNVGGNKLSGQLRIKGVPKLRALIANDNEITSVKGLGRLPDLNTLVLKNNGITELGNSLRGCSALEKLSLAHNEVSDLADSLAALPQLQELRVGHNDLSGLPPQLAANTRLKIVDIGGNPMRSFADIQVLSKLPLLQQLGIKGCQLTAADPDHPAALMAELPLLEVLDGRRVRSRIRGRLASQKPALESAATGSLLSTTEADPGAKQKGKRSDTAAAKNTASANRTAKSTGSATASADAPVTHQQQQQQAGETQRQQQGQHQAPQSPRHQSQQKGVDQQRQKQPDRAADDLQPATVDSDSDGEAAKTDSAVDGGGDSCSFLERVLRETGPAQSDVPRKAKGKNGKRANRVGPSETGLLAVISAAQEETSHKASKRPTVSHVGGLPGPGEAADVGKICNARQLSGTGVAAMLSSSGGILPQIGRGIGDGWGDDSSTAGADVKQSRALDMSASQGHPLPSKKRLKPGKLQTAKEPNNEPKHISNKAKKGREKFAFLSSHIGSSGTLTAGGKKVAATASEKKQKRLSGALHESNL